MSRNNINIYNLYPSGTELFQDSESFLNELTDRDLKIVGGIGEVQTVDLNGGTVITVYGDNLDNQIQICSQINVNSVEQLNTCV